MVATIDVLRLANKKYRTTVRASFTRKTAIKGSYRMTAECSSNVHIMATGRSHIAAQIANRMVTAANTAFATHGRQMTTAALCAVHVDRTNASHARASRMMQSTNGALQRRVVAHGASYICKMTVATGIAPALPRRGMSAMALWAARPAWWW